MSGTVRKLPPVPPAEPNRRELEAQTLDAKAAACDRLLAHLEDFSDLASRDEAVARDARALAAGVRTLRNDFLEEATELRAVMRDLADA